MLLSHYLEGLLANFTDGRTLRNITALIHNMIEHTSIRLWSISRDKAQFERSKRLLDGSLRTGLDAATTAEALRQNGSHQIALSGHDADLLVLAHDPCEIRKPYASALEHLGTVRSLEGRLIPGYQTFNTVVMNEDGTSVQPLDISVYSTGAPEYVSEQELTQFRRLHGHIDESPSMLCPQRVYEIQARLNDDTYVNLNRVVRAQLTRVSQHMQSQCPHRRRCHLFDRQFDSESVMTLLDQDLKDWFVIRLKRSRNAPGIWLDGSPAPVKLPQVPCEHGTRYSLSKIRLNTTTYHKVTCVIEWTSLRLADGDYTLVRVLLLDRWGRFIFADPMLLLTNMPVRTSDDACRVYRLYLLRAKIEGVFKFCKTVLGWEEAQVRDYESLTNLLALAYYVAGYFYAIDSDLIEDPVIAVICQLGGGKGESSRYFFLQGLAKLLIYQTVVQFKQSLREERPGEGLFEAMMRFVS